VAVIDQQQQDEQEQEEGGEPEEKSSGLTDMVAAAAVSSSGRPLRKTRFLDEESNPAAPALTEDQSERRTRASSSTPALPKVPPPLSAVMTSLRPMAVVA
jgi:hypothetical protein